MANMEAQEERPINNNGQDASRADARYGWCDMVLVPEGPVAFDGSSYRYSKGELRYIEEVARGFRTVTVLAFAFRPGDELFEAAAFAPFTAANVRVVEIPRAPENASPGRKAWQFVRVLLIALRVVPRAHLAYLFVPGYPSVIAWLLARIWRIPHCVYAADDWEAATDGMFKWPDRRGGLLYAAFGSANRVFERLIATSSLFAVTAGRALLAKYQRFGCAAYETSPRITLGLADICPRADTCAGDTVRLLHVGHLVHDKAQHVLLQAFARLQRECPRRVTLEIIGQGPREAELRQLCEQLGVREAVTFVGHIQEDNRLNEHYRNADIFVLSSVSEGFPRVLYEAMAAHLPLVSTAAGGIPNLLDDYETARLVPCNNPEALFEAIREVIEDAALRRRLISKAATLVGVVLATRSTTQVEDLLHVHGFDSLKQVSHRKVTC